MNNFSGNVAVITGGASGLGKEFARTGAKLGMKLVIADIQQDALDTTVEEFRTQGVEAIGLRTDVSRAEDVQALADAAMEKFGKINLLFNNAGVTVGGMVWENTEKDWEWLLGVNLHGVVHGLRIFTPLMLAEAARDPSYEGHIVNTASMAGLATGPGMGIYSVSKYAVVALTEALHYDLSLATDQVRCSALCPSYVATNIGKSDRNRPQQLANDTPLTKSQLAAREITQSLLDAGPVTAAEVSERTFEAVREQAFYIFPDLGPMPIVERRFEAVVAQSNPPPFEGVPMLNERGARLRSAIDD